MNWNLKNNTWTAQTQPPTQITDSDELAALQAALAQSLGPNLTPTSITLSGDIVNGAFIGEVTVNSTNAAGARLKHAVTIGVAQPKTA